MLRRSSEAHGMRVYLLAHTLQQAVARGIEVPAQVAAN